MPAKCWGNSIEGLAPESRAEITDGDRYSAFHRTGLAKRFRSNRIEDIIIAGVMTNCRCESTARDAFVRDCRVLFASDAYRQNPL